MTQRPTDEFLSSSPTKAQGATPEPDIEPALAPVSPPSKRRSRSGGPPQRKGGFNAVRQNFSMHPALMKTIIDAAYELGRERSEAIVDDRARRVTYSKIVAALVWLLKTRFMTKDGNINDGLRRLVADYEASFYERPDDSARADEIMEARRLYAAQFPAIYHDEHDHTDRGRDEGETEIDYTDRDEDEDDD